MFTDAVHELTELEARLRAIIARGEDESVATPLRDLESAASKIAQAWSGSSIGFHSCVYYKGLQPPPPGAHFSQEWGFLGMFQGTTGDWHEYEYSAVYDAILKLAGQPDTSVAEALADEATAAVREAKSTLESIFSSVANDPYVDGLRTKAQEVAVLTGRRATELQLPRGTVMTRDTTALGQGLRAAPHQAVIGLVVGCRSPLSACEELANFCKQAAAHLQRANAARTREERASGKSVFLGHGRSPLWRELKDFIHDRLGLPWEEFNRVPVAGVTNVERLIQMLDESGIAFLILTAEDERADGSTAARLNVVHEAGLFQGRLGFARAIVLLEDGCEEFSNIAGLGQIRFPTGNIAASFEEIRRVLEREGFVD